MEKNSKTYDSLKEQMIEWLKEKSYLASQNLSGFRENSSKRYLLSKY